MCEAVVDRYDDSATRYNYSNETFVMADVPHTVAASIKHYDDRVLSSFAVS